MQIDPRSHIPIYLQIADGIREAVAAGRFRKGEALPSLRAMALEVQVNPNTVQRAYDELSREGLVYSQRGKGLFVAEAGEADARSQASASVRQSFDDGVRTGRAAGMAAKEVRRIFDASMRARQPEENGG